MNIMGKESEKEEKDLVISIVTYGTSAETLAKFITYMGLGHLKSSYDFLIVDNMGSNDVKEYCLENSYNYTYPGKNLGFGAGHNVASRYFNAAYKVHLILNPDVFISPQTIDEVVAYIKDNEAVSLVSPRLLNEDGSIQNICRFLPTVQGLAVRFLTKYFAVGVDRLEDEFNFTTKPIVVPAIHGACFFVKERDFLDVGGFDEDYFLYVEDIDLCRQLGNLGSIVYLPVCTAIHTHAQGSYKSLKLFLYHLRSFVVYFRKWGVFIDTEGKRINKSAISVEISKT